MAQARKSDLKEEPRTNWVWIELESPRKLPRGRTNKHGGATDLAHAEEIAQKATNMLQRLFPGTHKKFWWDAHRCMWSFGDTTGYEGLPDKGKYFDLDHLGKPPENKLQRIIDLERDKWALEQEVMQMRKLLEEASLTVISTTLVRIDEYINTHFPKE
jgi:hypothetical protein